MTLPHDLSACGCAQWLDDSWPWLRGYFKMSKEQMADEVRRQHSMGYGCDEIHALIWRVVSLKRISGRMNRESE